MNSVVVRACCGNVQLALNHILTQVVSLLTMYPATGYSDMLPQGSKDSSLKAQGPKDHILYKAFGLFCALGFYTHDNLPPSRSPAGSV